VCRISFEITKSREKVWLEKVLSYQTNLRSASEGTRYRPAPGSVGSGQTGSLTAEAHRYIHGNNRVLSRSGSGTDLVYTQDRLGSVRRESGQGGIAQEFRYDVYGNSLGDHTPGMYGYTGKPIDPLTRLYDYGFRDYAPLQARFTTIDPVRDGVNWYNYVNHDPVNFIDPLGLLPDTPGDGKAQEEPVQGTLNVLAGGSSTLASTILETPWELMLPSLTLTPAAVQGAIIAGAAALLQGDTQPTHIYRSGSGNAMNMTPRKVDTTGLSFSLTPPESGPYTSTTLEAVNATGVLGAVQDGQNHVSVMPYTQEQLDDWIESRPTALADPHALTLIMQGISTRKR
jgi:RHS repeat-associated protein